MTQANTTLAHALAARMLDAIISKYQLTENKTADGGPRMTLKSAMSPDPVGALRTFSGGPGIELMTISIGVPAIQMDSHMLFAFTPKDSAIPHFTVDSVFVGGSYAFHLDLVPRQDLGANLAYLDEVYRPLTEANASVKNIDGLTPAHLEPRQWALMSPWMLAHRADENAFIQINEVVDAYLNRWFKLVSEGVSEDAITMSGEALAERDRLNRAAIFNPEVDPVWARVEKLIGQEDGETMRQILRGEMA